MNGDNDDRLSTEQYTDMYRKLPRNSSTRRQIESLLNNEARRFPDSRYHVGGVNQESGQSAQAEHPQLVPRTNQIEDVKSVRQTEPYKYPMSRHGHMQPESLFGSYFGTQINSMRRRMDEQFKDMFDKISEFSGDDSHNREDTENYSFSKRTHSHTFVDGDGKKYTEMNIRTSKNANGAKSASSKRVLRRDGDEVTVIKHNDGRTQVVGNEKLLDEFPSAGNKYITGHSTDR